LYLLLSLPLSRVARSVEARLKSVTFAPKGDLTVMALEVLAGGVALGLICGVLAKGFAGQTILSQFTQYLTAILLTLTIMVFVMLVLGAIIYIPASLIRLWRRRSLQRERAAESRAPVAVAS
jgi:hypothetical protein